MLNLVIMGYSACTLKLEGCYSSFPKTPIYLILASFLRPSQSPLCNHATSGKQKVDTYLHTSVLELCMNKDANINRKGYSYLCRFPTMWIITGCILVCQQLSMVTDPPALWVPGVNSAAVVS